LNKSKKVTKTSILSVSEGTSSLDEDLYLKIRKVCSKNL